LTDIAKFYQVRLNFFNEHDWIFDRELTAELLRAVSCLQPNDQQDIFDYIHLKISNQSTVPSKQVSLPTRMSDFDKSASRVAATRLKHSKASKQMPLRGQDLAVAQKAAGGKELDANSEHIGKCIRQLRKQNHLRQSQLAKLSGVSIDEISRYETGQRRIASPASLKKLAPHLGVPYERLMQAAGYVETIIDRKIFRNHVWRDSDGYLVDVYREPELGKEIRNTGPILELNAPSDKRGSVMRLLEKPTSNAIDENYRALLRRVFESM
jgi:transcriptional regulator with XRE-family HTH domain